jgi:alkaline phosphatase D
MDRRRFLLDLSVCTLALAELPGARRVTWRPRFAADPFALGVASGDPQPDGVVLWTRLAPDPLADDGFGGLTDDRIAVGWEVADDDRFARVVRRGVAPATRELGYSVHVEVDGLAPDRWYFYRFTAGDVTSPVGRTRTAPSGASAGGALHFAFASCQHFEQGVFTAYEHLAEERLDLVAHLGDYIYEGPGLAGRVRRHDGAEITSLRDYRRRYAQYKADPALQRAHAACPWLVTWDDHEVDNNYAAGVSERNDPADAFLARRAAAYQAWYEHQPVRVPRPRRWSDLAIHRAVAWGPLARFWVLDTRQYRSDQACGDGRKALCDDALVPGRTLLGDAQERWLADGLAASPAEWQVIAQQVMVAPFVATAQEQVVRSMDQWSGYPEAQRRLVETLGERAPGRAVVITGDIHSSWTNDLRADFERPETPVLATEFVGTSITSGGNGSAGFVGAQADQLRARNPHIQWHNARRGYVHCTVDRSAWTTRYRTVPYVDRPGAPVETAATFRVERGRPGAVQA